MADATAPPPEPRSTPSHLTLADEFPTPTRDEWRSAVAAVLARSKRSGDAPPEDPEAALSFTTYDDIRIRPLYTAEEHDPADGSTDDGVGLGHDGAPGQPPFVRGASSPAPCGTAAGEPGEARSDEQGWDVRVRHAGPDPRVTNAAVLQDLERGATSLWLVLGAGALTADDLPTALEGVLLDLAPVVLDAGADVEAAARALLALADGQGVAPDALRGSFGADPIGTRARTGSPADLDVLARLADLVRDRPGLPIATVDGTVFHDAGAADAQEIGLATAVGVAYLRRLVDAGLSVDDALRRIEFRLAVTAEQFPSMAKLRAARRVWDRVAELCAAADDRAGQQQHAVTSAAMLTRRDPWVNMLRTTIGCFAAAVGGAQSVTVTPFDDAIGVPDDFGRRVARNTQAVLHDEAGLGRVLDAAGGSWFVETLTDDLARAAWTVFTDLESRGGALVCLDDGTVDGLLAGTRQRRDDDIAHRRAPITGVSEFAFVDEPAVDRVPRVTADRDGALLPVVRYAAAYESLRDRADAAAQRPAVFLAGLGPLAVHSARSGFAANLFQAGGLKCVRGSDGDGLDALVAAFRDAGTDVACLCSTDPVYGERGPEALAALRDAGARHVWLAGQVDLEGIDGQLFTGCDALSVLHTTFETLAVK